MPWRLLFITDSFLSSEVGVLHKEERLGGKEKGMLGCCSGCPRLFDVNVWFIYTTGLKASWDWECLLNVLSVCLKQVCKTRLCSCLHIVVRMLCHLYS